MDNACDIRIIGNNQVLAEVVNHNGSYKKGYFYCPECNSSVFLTHKGIYSRVIFEHEHSPVAEKTEIQKKCSRYTNKEDQQKYEPTDSYKIADSIPLYLAGKRGNFNLIAYFPQISSQAIEILQRQNARIYIPQSNTCLNIEYTPYYQMDKYCKNNLKVEICDKHNNLIKNIPEEVKRKWLCGISGLQSDVDIFHSWENGGVRVAKKGFIYIGTTYRILRPQYFDFQEIRINGVKSGKLGEIYFDNQERFSIYEITATELTDEALTFFRERGHILMTRTDQLIPLWPPAVLYGRDLIYCEDKAFFLHKTSSQNKLLDKVFLLENDRIEEASADRICKINQNAEIVQINLASDISKPIMLSGKLTPMCYDVQQSQDIRNCEVLCLTKEWNISDKNNTIISDLSINKLPPSGTINVSSNIPMKITVAKGNYVKFSNYKSGYVDKIKYGVELTINYGAWGSDTYSFKKEIQPFKYDEIYRRLLYCRGKTIPMNYSLVYTINKLKYQSCNEIPKLYILLQRWTISNSMPVSALPIMKELVDLMSEE